MKRLYLLILAVICITAVSCVIFTRAFCEDDDPGFDALCNTNGYFRYDELVASALCQTGLLYEQRNDALALQPIILYLEKKEKSPPINPASSLTV